jgi:hypothetical protein
LQTASEVSRSSQSSEPITTVSKGYSSDVVEGDFVVQATRWDDGEAVAVLAEAEVSFSGNGVVDCPS